MFTRRSFVRSAAASLAMLAHTDGNANPTVSRRVRRSVEHGRPLYEFQYGQISLQSDLHQTQLKQTHSVLMNLSEDSLLRPYRLRVGLPAPGCDLGGWYSSDAFGAETFGQWISALSRYYAISRDEGTRAKVDRIIRMFAQTVEPTGKLFGDPTVTKGPAYMYDKLACGLMDAHQFTLQPTALKVLADVTGAVMPQLPDRVPTDDLYGAHETYTIPENQFIAWQRGGDSRHLDMAARYMHHAFFDPLSRGENVLARRHAYSHVNALCSAAKAFLVLGDDKYLRAAKYGFAFVEEQSFATGGWGPNETFLPNPGSPQLGTAPIHTLGDSLSVTHSHFETCCGAYAHFKLTRYLLRTTKDPSYGDSMERVMYNTVLGASPLLQDGRSFYNADYHFSDGRKSYFDGYFGRFPFAWPCCSGTLPQMAADYHVSTYFHDVDGVYVNLYVPSTLAWQQQGVPISLAQSGDYPIEDTVSITVAPARPCVFSVRLRIPSWTTRPSISINGKRVATPAAGTFATLTREWRQGDRIELELPRRLQLKAIDSGQPNIVAILYGPLVLFSIDAHAGQLTRPQLLAARRPDSQGSEWHVNVAGGRLRLVPFWAIKYERYSTYLRVA
jgi:uncharacterized protein